MSLNDNCPYAEPKCEDVGCDCPKYLAYVDARDPEKVNACLKESGFDTSLATWPLMMQMQRSFAARMHAVDGLTKADMDRLIDMYLVCIDDEVREAREHLNIYGDRPPVLVHDVELQKEIIDIAHFMMDMFIVGAASADDVAEAYARRFDVVVNDDLITDAYTAQCTVPDFYLSNEGDSMDLRCLRALCKLQDACGLVRQQISWKHWKKPSDHIDRDKLLIAYAEVFRAFINLCALTMTVDDIGDLYVRKNVENILRQKHGY